MTDHLMPPESDSQVQHRMTASRDNQRFFILGLVLTVVAVTTIALVALLDAESQKGYITIVMGFSLVIVTQVLGMWRNEQVGSRAVEQVQEVKEKVEQIENVTNGNLQSAIHKVAEEVRVATKEQIINELPLPKSSEELGSMLSALSTEICHKLMDDVEAKYLNIEANLSQKHQMAMDAMDKLFRGERHDLRGQLHAAELQRTALESEVKVLRERVSFLATLVQVKGGRTPTDEEKI